MDPRQRWNATVAAAAAEDTSVAAEVGEARQQTVAENNAGGGGRYNNNNHQHSQGGGPPRSSQQQHPYQRRHSNDADFRHRFQPPQQQSALNHAEGGKFHQQRFQPPPSSQQHYTGQPQQQLDRFAPPPPRFSPPPPTNPHQQQAHGGGGAPWSSKMQQQHRSVLINNNSNYFENHPPSHPPRSAQPPPSTAVNSSDSSFNNNNQEYYMSLKSSPSSLAVGSFAAMAGPPSPHPPRFSPPPPHPHWDIHSSSAITSSSTSSSLLVIDNSSNNNNRNCDSHDHPSSSSSRWGMRVVVPSSLASSSSMNHPYSNATANNNRSPHHQHQQQQQQRQHPQASPTTNSTPIPTHSSALPNSDTKNALISTSTTTNNNDTTATTTTSTPTTRDYEQEQADNTEYTQSLHWKNAKSNTIEKRPIDLPLDVDHIEDVEWGGDNENSGTSSGNAAASHNTVDGRLIDDHNHGSSSSSTANSHHHQHLISQITQLEKAPRPKYKRPEPCFCEPDIDTESKCCVDETCALYACQEECGNNCPGGPLCGNKRIQRKEWKKLCVFDAGLKGRGLMVQEPVSKGEFIIEYVGVAVKRQYLDGLFSRYKHERMLYIMALDGDIYLDARHRGGIARYINHSCEPNCVVHRWKVRGIIRACVFALRDIREGEELSFDYQWDRKRGRAVTKCYCGSEKCRGTLEIPKDCEEVEELEELEGHWIEPNTNSSGRVGKEIMNRVIKVYFDDDGEDYVADVAQYDPESGRHQLMYRGDNAEVWTDLSKEKWMILDEEGEKYVIARKDRNYENEDSLLISSSNVASPRGSDVSRSTSPLIPGAKVKNYMYIQSPVKDTMLATHILYKCQRHSRVHIDVTNITVRDRPGDGEDNDLTKAMDASEDGSVWKLVVTGLEVKKAIEWLEKQNTRITNKLNGVVEPTPSSLLTDQLLGEGGKPNYTEMIIPRVVLDVVRKRFFSLKGYCYNVDVDFKHSDSKSKQFAKLTLSADAKEDMEKAMKYLNDEIEKECVAIGAPMVNDIGCFQDLGFLGGLLLNEDYQILFNTGKGSGSPSKTIRASEDLQDSAFVTSFQKKNRCSIWVQTVEDMGRVSNNRVINEANPNSPRKIFFGAPPNRISGLWGYLQTRLADLKRGVEYMNLGTNRIYQCALMEPLKKNGRPASWNYFFDFVRKTSGASVQTDPITNDDHLRIDGGDASLSELSQRRVKEKVSIARELIALQIELLRDHHIRQHRWGFGRDWALILESTPTTQQPHAGSNSSQDLTAMAKASTADSMRLSDPRAVGVACLEIAEIVTSAGLSENVSAHACVIFYRYISLPDAIGLNSNFKLRDIQLASLFIANKSQKVKKWNRLEAVLEHAYRVFYPGSLFNPNSEEAKNWERRVIKAEKTLLSTLNFDVFWTGVDWVINAVTGTKAMTEPLAENAMALALSGHVLAAGPVLWLKYGPKYAFAAIAAFLSMDIEPLIYALALDPLTLSDAAERIYHSCQALTTMKKSFSSQHAKHELFSDGKSSLMAQNIVKIQSICGAYKDKHSGQLIDDSKFVSSPAYREISERSKLREVFRNVKADIIEQYVLPILGKTCFESKCNIWFADGLLAGTSDIVLEGNWKSLAIAAQMLCEAASLPAPILYTAPRTETDVIKQAKVQPGLLDMKKIDGKHGWYGTADSSEIFDAGWKTCVAASAPQEHLDSAGLRWWVPHKYGPSLSGSLCQIFSSPRLHSRGSVDMSALALLARSFTGGKWNLEVQYPTIASFLPSSEGDDMEEDNRAVAVSLQRWPAEKAEQKEQSNTGGSMQMGFSVSALQEMQLLHQLHFLIPSPQGHPNFILPLAIALDSDNEETKEPESSGTNFPSKAANDILAMIEKNQRAAAAGKKQVGSGSHLVMEPTPLNLQKVMSRYQRKKDGGLSMIPSSVLASWCHDIISAISFCHSNHIILRSLLPEQIYLDNCGTAKFSGLSKVMVLHGNDRTKDFNPLKYVRSKKSKDHNTEDVEPFAAPELLLGGTRHTKETDMWALGALVANLLLGKQLFPGKDRISKMTQVFKIAGVPETGNFEDAKKFPYYSLHMYVLGDEGKRKKYNRGVEKALRHMLKLSKDTEEVFSGLVSLLDGLLHLDPKKRLTAEQALDHPYIRNHCAQIDRKEFQQNYVKDWLELKEVVLTNGKSSKSKHDSYGSLGGDGINEPVESPEDLKRKALLMSASSGADGGDDLYDLGDLIEPSSKKSKFSEL
jgi:histone-lysine N-methyltransferase SETD2